MCDSAWIGWRCDHSFATPCWPGKYWILPDRPARFETSAILCIYDNQKVWSCAPRARFRMSSNLSLGPLWWDPSYYHFLLCLSPLLAFGAQLCHAQVAAAYYLLVELRAGKTAQLRSTTTEYRERPERHGFPPVASTEHICRTVRRDSLVLSRPVISCHFEATHDTESLRGAPHHGVVVHQSISNLASLQNTGGHGTRIGCLSTPYPRIVTKQPRK